MQQDNSKSQNKENKKSKEDDGNPRFGRLLLILIAAVGLIVFITFASESYYS